MIFMGEALRGHDEIARNHAEVFARWQKGTMMVVRVIGIQRLSDNIWSVLTIGGVGREAPIAFDKFQTYTLVRDDKDLRCVAFQNTAMSERASDEGLCGPKSRLVTTRRPPNGICRRHRHRSSIVRPACYLGQA